MEKKNPIELEVDKVEAQWEEFIESKAPILRWLISPSSNQLVSTFIRVQEECDDKVSDFFMPLYSALLDSENYGFDLVEEIQQLIETERENLTEADDIVLPSVSSTALDAKNGCEALLVTASDILETIGEGFEYLVLVLRPSKLSSAKDWRHWCGLLADYSGNKKIWPNNLRVVLLDDSKHPILDAVAQTHPANIFTRIPPVNLNQAINQIFDKADDGSPGASYRKNYAATMHAVEDNNLHDVELYSEAALAIAGQHQWYDLWVAILLLRASAYMSNTRIEDAIYDYQTAQRFAKMGQEQGVQGCDKQWIFALLSEASAWLSVQDWVQATEAYLTSAELSERFNEHFFQMDSWRMVCFCQEKQKQNSVAWESGLNALTAAEALKEDEREASTLPYVGEALMRLAPSANDKREVDQKMQSYLGEDWLQMIAQPEAEAAAC